MPDDDRLEPGLYETPITRRIEDEVAGLGDLAEAVGIEPADAHVILTRHLTPLINAALRSAPDLKAKVDLANSLLGSLEKLTHGYQMLTNEEIIDPGRELQAILVRSGLQTPRAPARPRTPLSQDALIANAPLEPNLAAELASEIESADHIDLICAFVVWSGLAELMDGLRSAAKRGVPIRILTTTYSGITQAMALERLIAIGAALRSAMTLGPPGCMQRLGDSTADLVSARLTSGPRTSRTRLSTRDSNGTFASLSQLAPPS
jgi:hypothetical protein